MTEDEAIVELQKIDWESMTLGEAQKAAKVFMGKWSFTKKVAGFCLDVDKKTSVKEIAVFMWSATMKGLEIKQRAALGKLRYA